jgi:DNA-binding NarL/FixJ family response regulator
LRDPSVRSCPAPDTSVPSRLTGREWQILSLLNENLPTSEIAKRLSLTPATVRSHRARALRKLCAAGDGAFPYSETSQSPAPVSAGQQSVVIASPDSRLRTRLRAALASAPGLSLCAEEANAPAAVSAVAERGAAVCILDRTLDGRSVRATAELSARLPMTKVIVLVSDPQPKDLRAHIWAGAAGYLNRTMKMERIPQVVHAVLEGNAAIPRGLMASLVADFRDSAPRRRPIAASDLGGCLTSREWHVLDLLRRGCTTRETADRLYLSEVTIRTHVASILRKLEVPDRAAAFRVAARLLDSPYALSQAS